MWLGRRIQTGIAMHAAVNLVFGACAVASALGGASAAASAGAPADAGATRVTRPPWSSPLHATHPLLTAAPVLFPPTTAAPPPEGETTAESRRVVSTGYCLEGITASGRPVGPGMVAMNGVDLGTRWVVHDGPHAGATYEVTDRIGRGTEFDIWFDDCSDAVAYGRRTITIESA